MEQLYSDLRYAVRSLLKTPQFTVTVIVLLGIGLGASASMFSIVNAFRFRPLPVRDGGNMVVLSARRAARTNLTNLSYPNFEDIRDRNGVFSSLIAYNPIRPRVSTETFSGISWGQVVTGNYFQELGVTPLLGRGLTPGDDTPGAPAVVAISDVFWKNSLASDPSVIGKRIYLNGYPFTVSGVMAEGFHGTNSLLRADLWVAAEKSATVAGASLTNRQGNQWRILGRLKPETTLSQAQANLDLLSTELQEQFPTENRGLSTQVFREKHARPEPSASNLASVLWAFLMAMGFVLLGITGANVTSLMFARSAARQHEISVRLALGATRPRLFSQLLIESLLLSLCGGALGFWIDRWWMQGFSTGPMPANFPWYFDFQPDNTVLLFTMVLAAASGLLVGLAPAFLATRHDLQVWLKDGPNSTRSPKRSRLQACVITSQFAMVTLLLVLAALFMRSAAAARTVDVGFETDNRLLFSISTDDNGYDATRGRQLLEDLLARTRALPGVSSVEAISETPLGFDTGSMEVRPFDKSNEQPIQVGNAVTSTTYLRTIGVPIIQGRAFEDGDRLDSPRVVIVNETLAANFWPGQNPIGKKIVRPGEGTAELVFEVIGVARNAKYRQFTEGATNFFYLPYAQNYRSGMTLMVETGSDRTAMIAAVRGVLRDLDPALSLFDITTFDELIDLTQVSSSRVGASLLGGSGLLGVALAVLGLYGLLSYGARVQTREIGIRMALGATAATVVKLFVSRGLRLAIIGTGIGMMLALALTRVVGSFLIGTSSVGFTVFAAVAGLIATVTIIAAYLPARRVLARNPMAALRHD